MRGRTLRWLLERIDTSRMHYISGELRMGSRLDNPVEDLQLYRPARFTGQVLHLHYARAQDLERYVGMLAAEGELFVQFWLRPEDKPLELVIEEQGDLDVIPAELRQFL
jgi:inner membrane protein